ncbi:MAG: tRNA epoxyqueuosine(34) reductase QueG, partial [Gammaproteobacteria bacterium]
IDLSVAEQGLQQWLARGFQGDMEWMARHGSKRSHPEELQPGTASIISVRMNYLPSAGEDLWAVLQNGERAYISRYALGRDYHKLMRKRLQQLADHISAAIGGFGYRVFVDSAPVLEKPIAQLAGLGWAGKHTNIINREAGSWFFLGEIYTDLALPTQSAAAENHCGTCTACIEVCPTGAIVAPYQLDARRCISYLTIEHAGSIPPALRPAMGNRIYGCDDCQLVCPWNRFAHTSQERDFQPRHALDSASLLELFCWDEAEFLRKTEGSAIRRIGHERWLRNIAIALGNAPTTAAIVEALQQRRQHPSAIVREHVDWALQQHSAA